MGSMFLDGMRDQLSGLEQKDETGEEDHAEGDPLDGVEELGVWFGVRIGLAEEAQEKLSGTSGGQGQGECVAGVLAVAELTHKEGGDNGGSEGGIEGYGVERYSVGRNAHSPWERSGKAGIGAFGEVSEGEEEPDEGGAGTPCVEGGEERETLDAQIDCGGDNREEDSDGVDRRQRENEKGIDEETERVGDDDQKAGEDEGGEKDDETSVPELIR